MRRQAVHDECVVGRVREQGVVEAVVLEVAHPLVVLRLLPHAHPGVGDDHVCGAHGLAWIAHELHVHRGLVPLRARGDHLVSEQQPEPRERRADVRAVADPRDPHALE